jgi:hypothetical protein
MTAPNTSVLWFYSKRPLPLRLAGSDRHDRGVRGGYRTAHWLHRPHGPQPSSASARDLVTTVRRPRLPTPAEPACRAFLGMPAPRSPHTGGISWSTCSALPLAARCSWAPGTRRQRRSRDTCTRTGHGCGKTWPPCVSISPARPAVARVPHPLPWQRLARLHAFAPVSRVAPPRRAYACTRA